MQINCFIWIADKPMGDDESALGAIMELNKIIWILDTPTEGRSIGGLRDTSAPPLSPHSLRSGQALSEAKGLVALGCEMLRCAQHDNAVTIRMPESIC
jgi:hypothetical protein